ncbi:MAG: hypothetical protein ACYDGN_16295 [Acidimicrobiales bacterium]
MTNDLTAIQLRVALPPRAARPLVSRKAPRRAVLVHEHDGRHAVIETLDGLPLVTHISIGPAPSEAEVDAADAWAAQRQAAGVGTLEIVTREVLGKRIEQRCFKSRAEMVVYGLDDFSGNLAVHSRPARGGGRTDTWPGCGWVHRETGEPMDAFDRGRLKLLHRGGEGGVFAAWLPPRHLRRSRRRRGGPITQPDVLGAALGCDASSPAALAESLGIAWPEHDHPLDQLLGETLALAEVYRALVAELAEVAPGMAPQDCWSAGSIATYTLRAAGMRSPAETTAGLPPEVVGACASAFHGGPAEAHLTGIAVPMALFDENATYPTMFSLLGLTPHLLAHHFESKPATTAEVRRLFPPNGFRERLDSRDWWESISTLFVEVEPHGEKLPVHRAAGDGFRFVVAPLDYSGGRLWVHAADLVAPALAGQLPRIVSAFRVVPVGIA